MTEKATAYERPPCESGSRLVNVISLLSGTFIYEHLLLLICAKFESTLDVLLRVI